MRRISSEHPDQAVNLLLVFPLLRTPPGCVREVELWLRVLRFDHQFRYQEPQLGAYPSQLVSLATADPATRTAFETLLDNRPTGFGYLTPDEAWLHFEITELYRTWAEGGPFPSALRTVPEGTPLIVDVRATDFGQPLFEARIAPLGPGDRPAPAVDSGRELLSRHGGTTPGLHPEDDVNIGLRADGAARARW